jgi:hypothetical protein
MKLRHKILSRIFAIGLALAPLAAIAQQMPVNLPASTVFGRLANGPGPAQAIPFATLLANITGQQAANTIYAAPSGSAGLPGFRALVGADLPAPGASSLGGAESLTCAASNWFYTLATTGIFGCRQPAFSDLTGTFTAAQCIAATGSALGCVKPDGSTITIAAGVLTAVSGSAASVDAAGGTSVTNCGTSGAGLYNTSSSKVGCAAGQWQLLATLTASNSATLSDTTHFTSTYTEYEIRFTNILPATGGTNLELQVHSGGSFQATSYLTNTFGTAGSTTVSVQNSTTFLPLNHGNGLINTGAGFSGFVRVANVAATTIPKIFSGVCGYPTSTVWATGTIGGIWNSNGAVDGIQILTSSGNITSGTVEIYGRL